jgi:predicted DCC family thiol-disulfide oxidoreductase YuxK
MEKCILLFDSGCKLCNTSIKFVTKGDKKQLIQQIAISSTQGQKIIQNHPSLLHVNSIVFIKDHQLFIESDAIIQIAQQLSFPYKLMAAGVLVPKKWRDLIYKWIAKNRYQWFGKIESRNK